MEKLVVLSDDERLLLKRTVCELIAAAQGNDVESLIMNFDEHRPLGTYGLFRIQLRMLQDRLNSSNLIRCFGGGLFNTDETFEDVERIVVTLRHRSQKTETPS